ncbi:FecR family protein [Reichenbachiella ulvae]|uniref:DUF4974 domain-containing protein n=1 Tax=Reichenbachiella ulvae TaxID=2980104 RepID=A0ABT3CUJ6_9BACT|nr:FecR family protein [Reichenbachiella ulvae]MCV9387262.1 DUF4974 domain-containing protein [Reichenbachiella ulvae]
MKDTSQGIFELLKNENFIRFVKHPTEDSIYYWEKWMENDPERRRQVVAASKIIQSSNLKRNQKMSEEVHDRIMSKIVDHSHVVSRRSARPSIQRKIWTYAVAASVALVIAISYFNNEQPIEEQPKIAWVEKHADLGQKITTHLPDGSVVVLNSGSTLSFPETFDKDHRSVKLITGEAFFDIKRNPDQPFYVHINEDKVKVLGTSFNIRNYPEDEFTQVAVATGQVAYTPGSGEKAVLKPNQMASYSKVDGSLRTSKVDSRLSFGWKEKVLYFKGDTLEEIVRKLERWYGVSIHLANGFKRNGTYSGEFTNQSLEHVLLGLSFIYEFEFEINKKDKEVWLK